MGVAQVAHQDGRLVGTPPGVIEMDNNEIPWPDIYSPLLVAAKWPYSHTFWWRGQGAAYLARFNARTAWNVSAYMAGYGPLPPGSISSHIRCARGCVCVCLVVDVRRSVRSF